MTNLMINGSAILQRNSAAHQITTQNNTTIYQHMPMLIHVHSCTCRCTVLCHRVSPLYTRWLLSTAGLYYFCKLPKLSITCGQK